MQHYALARDLEIAVIDGSRGLGNGLCLPAGPLRVNHRQGYKKLILSFNGRSSLSSLILSNEHSPGQLQNLVSKSHFLECLSDSSSSAWGGGNG